VQLKNDWRLSTVPGGTLRQASLSVFAMKASSGGGRRNGRTTPRRRIGVRPDHKEAVPESVRAEAARSKARDPTVKSGGAPHLPARVLIELRRGQIPPESFAAVLDAFGELPEEGQYDLALRIMDASAIYWLRKSVGLLPKHTQQKHLNRISTSARRLLALLGVNEPKSVAGGVRQGPIHPIATTSLLMELYRVALKRRPATATASADERLTILIVLLSDLVEAAELCALEIGTQYRKGQGGQRRAGQITAEVELMQAIIESYAELRKRFPNSGPQPAFDKRLLKFVRSGLKLVASDLSKPSRITDAAIRGAFVRWRG
jgi:hypothetical protein